MIKRQRLIGIVASLVLAGVGAGLLVAYVGSAERRAAKGEATVPVLVATEEIAKGTTAEDVTGKVKTELVPSKVAAQGALADIGPVAGLVTVGGLVPGEQLVQSRFAAATGAERPGLPGGLLEVTVAIDAVRALGGQVRGGDSVGVLVSFDDPQTTHMFLHKVPVTGVRTELGVPVTAGLDETAPTGKLLVTLAGDGPSVERMVFAAEHGRLWLSWEPDGADVGGTRVQTRAEVNL